MDGEGAHVLRVESGACGVEVRTEVDHAAPTPVGMEGEVSHRRRIKWQNKYEIAGISNKERANSVHFFAGSFCL